MKNYISVTIGRNVGNQPMDWDNWQKFIQSTRQAVQTQLQVRGWLFDGSGVGTWGNNKEESHAIIVLALHDELDNESLRKRLAMLAKRYHQEAVGLAVVPLPVGDETLVMAE